jgi:hypothetical protein
MKNLTSGPALATFLLLSLAGPPQASTQPRITSQPKSLAVLLNSNATFRVTATGTTPLAYQWQLDGWELSGATNATTVSSAPQQYFRVVQLGQ